MSLLASLSVVAGPALAGEERRVVDWTSPTVGRMRWIPPGTFTMGSPADEVGRDADEGQQRVTLTRGFLLMEHEVTQGEWEAVMGSNPMATGRRTWEGNDRGACAPAGLGPSLPVACVSWLDAVAFANALSAREGLTPVYTIVGETVTAAESATGYRLPTEAEWEYAARAGESWVYAGGDEPCAVANVANAGRAAEYVSMGYDPGDGRFADCDDGVAGLAPVGSYRPNGYGLYDMSGNVAELVWDTHPLPAGDAGTDPGAPGAFRVDRGGSWLNPPRYTRVADRSPVSPSNRHATLGLRLARSAPGGSDPAPGILSP